MFEQVGVAVWQRWLGRGSTSWLLELADGVLAGAVKRLFVLKRGWGVLDT